ncbi:MAG: FapA family protein [Caldimicrobium sp.]|nr:FapA family protein [Caldimicrobium sp.]
MEKEHFIDRKEAKEIGILFKEYVFKVSPDDYYLYIESPKISREQYEKFLEDWPIIKDFLQSQGIKFLLDFPKEINGSLVIAQGHPPKEGSPESIKLLPKFERIICSSMENEPNLQCEDLRERFQRIICAEAEEAVAQWFPSIPPTPGVNIWGDPIEPPVLKEKKTFELGSNVYLDEKDNFIKAKRAGVLTYTGGKLEILPEFTLKGNVDYFTGNVHFIGDKLIIQGDIKFGFTVTCKGNLELKGCTENKTRVEVEGFFHCDGIIRGEETTIIIKGDAYIRGVEFAKLVINGNLTVRDYLVFSDTFVNGNLIATEGKGIIYGGVVKVTGNINAKIIGYVAQTKTEIMAGYKPEIVKEYLHLIKKEITFKETLKRILYGIDLANKLKKENRLTKEKEKILEKLFREKEKIEKNLGEVLEKTKLFKDNLRELRKATIKVLNRVYPNVILGIADRTYTSNEEIAGPVTFYLEEAEIKISR